MTGWIILALLVLALSPLVWLVPSRRQRGQMDVRLQARRMGLAMQLTREQWPYWLSKTPPSPCPQYHRPRRRGREDSWCYWQSEPGKWLNRWQEPCAEEPLAAQLATLPADVYKVEATAQMIALYWGERAQAESLQNIAAFLQARA
ncbi:hypothetical protein [Phytopseudomonas dryadis]|uniref:Uncharacterized protein n=1 Tax=Phytopseudomonas dryadis TaxID=2487520 RepID=A0ABY1Z9M2_9GAMM|nr:MULTISPECIES: hypothetical protein [Pseudomonas]TBV07107.1 hypothetical protein DNK34_09810 [Pseudomonas dryadis]TBV19499.1 hypothetical protein DNK41_02905 [Pseudomonas sp. FRB 230]